MPPQSCRNAYIADFIARRSLKPAPMEEGGEGWTWRFDPQLWSKLDRSAMSSLMLEDSQTPLVHIFGANSKIVRTLPRLGHSPSLLDGLTKIVIPDSEHHIMVDQPLALVAAIRGLLVGWP